MGNAFSGFLAKLFSTDSIISRVVRAIAIASAYISAAGIPTTGSEWMALLAAVFAGFVPAGQNQSAPATPTAKRAVPPAA